MNLVAETVAHLGMAALVMLVLAGTVLEGAEAATSAPGNRKTKPKAEVIKLDPKLWSFDKRYVNVSKYRGRRAFQLTLRGYKGVFLKDSEFENGIIEVDLAASGEKYDFPGIIFRAVDDKQFECVYFRPLFSTSKGRKKPAVGAFQYFPAHAGEDSFRLYGAPKYEAHGVLPTDGSWFHARIEVQGPTVKVYVNRAETPSFVVKRLVRINTKGAIGLWSFGKGYFANLKVTRTAPSKKKTEERQAAKEYLSAWRISKGFSVSRGKRFEDLLKARLKEDKSKWKRVSTDHNGLLDCFRFTDGKTAVFVSTNIRSGKKQTKTLTFDYAMGCRMFLRGKQVYAGKNMRLRDGRLNVALALEKGDNELFVAVTRPSVGMFGLGLVARLDDLENVEIDRPKE